MRARRVQTRSEDTGLEYFTTVKEAFDYAVRKNRSVWKISFDVHGERVRLVREGDHWKYEDLADAVSKILG
jgi:hypothetical protein